MYIERSASIPLQRGERERLPERRQSETLDFVFTRQSGSVLPVHAGVSHYADGRLAEVFLQTLKRSTDTEDDARDIAVLLSVALQYGTPAPAIREALTRGEDGRAAGLAGAILDLMFPVLSK